MLWIDDRAGSGPRSVTRRTKSGYKYTKEYKGLIDFPPLNICQDCGSTFEWREKIGGEKFWTCPQSPNHSSLGQLTRLEVGDVCFSGNGPNGPILIGVEVKDIKELASSLASGRLQAIDTGQIPRMIKEYDVSWLLYYGVYRESPTNGCLQTEKIVKEKGVEKRIWVDYTINGRNMPYGYAESFLVSPSFTQTGMLSKRVMDIADAASWIGVLYRCWSKKYSQHKSMRVFHDPVGVSLLPGIDPHTKLMMNFIKGLPSLGFERALAVAQHFGSIEEMVLAEEKEWLEIDGIGKTIARSVREAVKRKRA